MVLLAELLQAHADVENIVRLGRAAGQRVRLPRAALAWLARPDEALLDADQAWLAEPGHHLLTLDHPAYPAALRDLSAPPPWLYAKGDLDLLEPPAVAIVGSRNPSPAGRGNALEFARTLAEAGLVIVSGLATGIDAAAHEGALDSKGMTIAVCGTGLDRIYPARNKALGHRIAEDGLMLSEFNLGTNARPGHFPRRNRVIAGLTLGTLVVEAARQSGSLITARMATEAGREVFAIPGSVHNPLARGCHRLIRDGAKLVEEASDVLEEIAPLLSRPLPVVAKPSRRVDTGSSELDEEYQQLLEAVGYEATSVDQIVEITGLTAAAVSSMLLALELQSFVSPAPGGGYMRISPSDPRESPDLREGD